MATTTQMESGIQSPPASHRIWPGNWLGPLDLQGQFPSEQPLELDLGSGKGRFLLARATAHPEINYLGIERQLVRIRKVDKKLQRQGLHHVRLLRIEAYYAVRYLLPPACLSTCYILFPDPWPKKKHAAHRIMNPECIDALWKALQPGAKLHFASDHLPYFYQVVRSLQADVRFTECEPFLPRDEERSDFELMFRNQKPIGRISWIRA